MDEEAVQSMSRCGMNMPSPDLLTTERSMASIWSWAPGHPFNAPPAEHLLPAAAGLSHAAESGWWQPWLQAGLQLGRRWLGAPMQQVQARPSHLRCTAEASSGPVCALCCTAASCAPCRPRYVSAGMRLIQNDVVGAMHHV